MRRKSPASPERLKLAELLGLAACPAPSPGLAEAIVARAPHGPRGPARRRPRWAMVMASAVLLVAVSVRIWQPWERDEPLSDVDALAAASELVL
jgi:hypothetical protein